jgi:hypothetical protein
MEHAWRPRFLVARGVRRLAISPAPVQSEPAAINYLNDFSARYRYPGSAGAKAAAEAAADACRKARRIIRTAFGLAV